MILLVSFYSCGLRNFYTTHFSMALLVLIIINMYGVYIVAQTQFEFLILVSPVNHGMSMKPQLLEDAVHAISALHLCLSHVIKTWQIITDRINTAAWSLSLHNILASILRSVHASMRYNPLFHQTLAIWSSVFIFDGRRTSKFKTGKCWQNATQQRTSFCKRDLSFPRSRNLFQIGLFSLEIGYSTKHVLRVN